MIFEVRGVENRSKVDKKVTKKSFQKTIKNIIYFGTDFRPILGPSSAQIGARLATKPTFVSRKNGAERPDGLKGAGSQKEAHCKTPAGGMKSQKAFW